MPSELRVMMGLTMAALAAIFCLRAYFLVEAYWGTNTNFVFFVPLYLLVAALLGARLFSRRSGTSVMTVVADSITAVVLLLLLAVFSQSLNLVAAESLRWRNVNADIFVDNFIGYVAQISLFLAEPIFVALVVFGTSCVAGVGIWAYQRWS